MARKTKPLQIVYVIRSAIRQGQDVIDLIGQCSDAQLFA
jgi:hypothetical protein